MVREFTLFGFHHGSSRLWSRRSPVRRLENAVVRTRASLDPSRGHWHPGRSYHVFKVNVDGSGLEQLTDGTWNDFDPCWLPNRRLAFISERRGGYLRCGRVCPTYTLFDMRPDGTDIRCLSYHETNEWHPTPLTLFRVVLV